MMAALIERQIAATERQLGESADWLRDLYATSRAGFFKFALFMPLSRHRAHAADDLGHVARIAAAASEDEKTWARKILLFFATCRRRGSLRGRSGQRKR